MKLRIFNIQLLPLDHKNTGDAGENRYIELFNKLNESVTKTIKQKRLVADAKPLINDSFFAALNCEKHVHKNLKDEHTFIVGRFIKFHQAGEVEDLYTKATLFKAQEGQDAVANRKEFLYIFDPVSHWLGIEEQNGRLPNHRAVKSALEQYLLPIAESFFPDYTLTVNLVSREDELNSVLERAVGFTKIEVDITFKNGPTQDEVLRDMAANSLHRLKITASSDRGSHMPHIPKTIEGFVKNAPQYGQASITYLEKNSKGGTNLARYESEANPQTISARAQGNEDPMSFYGRMVVKIKDLARKIGHLPEVNNVKPE
ncbi:DUF4747 family protein [Delftia acidovorans]